MSTFKSNESVPGFRSFLVTVTEEVNAGKAPMSEAFASFVLVPIRNMISFRSIRFQPSEKLDQNTFHRQAVINKLT